MGLAGGLVDESAGFRNPLMFQVPPVTFHCKTPNGSDVVVRAEHSAGETLQDKAKPAGRDIEVAGLDPHTVGIRYPVWAVFQIKFRNEMLPASLVRGESVAETVESGNGHMCLGQERSAEKVDDKQLWAEANGSGAGQAVCTKLRRCNGVSGQNPSPPIPQSSTSGWPTIRELAASAIINVIEMRLPAAAKVVLAIGAALALPTVSSAQVKVIISGGFAPAYREVLPEFERTSGILVTTASGASQGTGLDTIGAMLRRGEPADVVILNRQGLAVLTADGKIVVGTEVDLAESLIGMAVRAGSPKPDISTVDAFRQTLMRAKKVAVPGSFASGFAEVLRRLGISTAIEVEIPSRGTESVAMVARGAVHFSIQPVSEILHMPGVEFAGTLPTELQHRAVYAAAIVAGSKQAEASRRLIAFLSSDAATAAIKRSGMEPSRR